MKSQAVHAIMWSRCCKVSFHFIWMCPLEVYRWLREISLALWQDLIALSPWHPANTYPINSASNKENHMLIEGSDPKARDCKDLAKLGRYLRGKHHLYNSFNERNWLQQPRRLRYIIQSSNHPINGTFALLGLTWISTGEINAKSLPTQVSWRARNHPILTIIPRSSSSISINIRFYIYI